MKMFRRLLVFVFCGALVSSCFDPPEYPDSPEISFKSVSFVKGGTQSNGIKAADTIVLMLNFKDGDGDVGVSSEETGPPFNDRWYYTTSPLQPDGSYYDDCTSYNNRCWFINPTITEFDKYIDVSDLKEPQYDTLFLDRSFDPPRKRTFSKPYNCVNWEVIYYDDDNNEETPTIPLDTLFFTLNPHYNNIFVTFEIKNDNPTDPSKPFDPFNEQDFFTYPNCGVRIFHGRIPVLAENPRDETPLEGTIRYAIPSVSFQTLFGAKTLRLRTYIEDRALHKSNEVTTREFTLTE